LIGEELDRLGRRVRLDDRQRRRHVALFGAFLRARLIEPPGLTLRISTRRLVIVGVSSESQTIITPTCEAGSVSSKAVPSLVFAAPPPEIINRFFFVASEASKTNVDVRLVTRLSIGSTSSATSMSAVSWLIWTSLPSSV
jgi:hypothetical protein